MRRWMGSFIRRRRRRRDTTRFRWSLLVWIARDGAILLLSRRGYRNVPALIFKLSVIAIGARGASRERLCLDTMKARARRPRERKLDERRFLFPGPYGPGSPLSPLRRWRVRAGRVGGAEGEALRGGSGGWGGVVGKGGGGPPALQNRLGFFRCCRTLGCAL